MSSNQSPKDTPRAYDTLEGSPTITFVGKHLHKMLPYHSFIEANLHNDATVIEVVFHSWVIAVEGHALLPLWSKLQKQSVRELREQRALASKALSQQVSCSVTSIKCKAVDSIEHVG